MCDPFNPGRRRFCRAAATTVAASQFGVGALAQAQPARASTLTVPPIDNTARSDERFFSCDWFLAHGEEPPLASHLVTPRAFYTHHGIYVGNGRVIHYSGLAYGLRRGPVEEISLERFAQDHGVKVRRARRSFGRCEVVERAYSRLGERRYRILTNNCEHFCAWALCDECRSSQIEHLGGTPRALYRAIRAPYERIERHHRAIARAVRLWWDHLALTRTWC